MKSIFIQIASFSDEELLKTINDAVHKSSGTTRINFGIHECYLESKTEIDLENVKIVYSKAPENIGVGVGRYLANQLYDGEDYYLQIDAHSRFSKNWDTDLIYNLDKYSDLGMKTIITQYPPGFHYVDGVEVYDENFNTSTVSIKRNGEKIPESLIFDLYSNPDASAVCSPMVSAAFIFGTGEISSVKQNPAVFFWGEETLKAASLFTSGFNIMSPDKAVVFHLYGVDSNRKPVWTYYPEISDKKEEFSKVAIKLILSEKRIGPRELGSERSLSDFGRYIGVDFDNGVYL
jgi:hypothetical protein